MNGHRDSSPGIGRQVSIRFIIIRPFSFLNTLRRHRSLNEPPPPPPPPPQTNNIIVYHTDNIIARITPQAIQYKDAILPV